jgi:hypothetical protein
MPSLQPITELVVYHIKEGVTLEKVSPNDPNPAVQVFMQLTEIVKAQKGFIRQFWVIHGLSCMLRGS